MARNPRPAAPAKVGCADASSHGARNDTSSDSIAWEEHMLRLGTSLTFLALLTTAAAADDRGTCLGGGPVGDEKVAACTRLILSKTLNSQDTVAAYTARGGSQGRTGDQDRAIADLNEALRLDPNNAFAIGIRASNYARKGDHE